jgi:DNA-binding NarL/FixJ family response regulator
LVALVGALPDADLAALARRYWLRIGVKANSPDDVACTRAIRRARKASKATPTDCPLSSRELEVVSLATDGLTMGAIGHSLGLSENTIKTHLSRILAKLHARNTTNAVAIALRAGWIT